MLSIMLAVVMLVTSVNISGFNLTKTQAATAYYPTMSYNLGKLSDKNKYLAKLEPKGKETTTASMCSISMAGGPVFCMLKGGGLSKYNAFYTADINKYGKSYQKYFRGTLYYYYDVENDYSLSTTARYVVAQIMLWRILQIRSHDKSGTYNNIMGDGFESTFKDIINYWGEANANTAWKEIKSVMTMCNNGDERVNEKYVEMYLWTHKDGTQPLLRGKVTVPPDKAGISIVKKGEVKDADVKGAQFGIYSKKECKDKSLICKITTNESGRASTSEAQNKKLKTNTTYYVKELIPPAGSKLSTKVYKVKTSATSGKSVKLTVTDEQYNISIHVVKKDSVTKKALDGAKFRLYEWDSGSSTYDYYNDYITRYGDFTTEELYYTKINQGKFMIEEIEAPEGYRNNGFRQYIQLGSGNTDITVDYTAENDPEPGWIEITKSAYVNGRDITEDSDLSATFTIYSDEFYRNKAGEIKTDANTGYGSSGDLVPGTYYIRETAWSAHLEPSTDVPQKVKVIGGRTTAINGKDGDLGKQIEKPVGLKLKKVDSDNGMSVAGAVFRVYQHTGSGWSFIREGTTDKKGMLNFPKEDNLFYYTKTNQGRFMVKETSAPDDYILDPTPRYVNITKDNEGTVIDLGEFKNTPKNGDLEIQKVISTPSGEKVTNLDLSGSYLNITYGLYTDEKFKNPVRDSIKLNKTGYAKVEDLPAGIYYLKETSANSDVFGNVAGLGTRTIEITINRGKTTYVDGEKGYSEDGKTWYDCWSNTGATTFRNSLPTLRTYMKSDFPAVQNVFGSDGSVLSKTKENEGTEQKEESDSEAVRGTRTINDIKKTWKKLADEELDIILAYSDEKEVGKFLLELSQDDLDLILSKKTRLSEPYAIYGPDDEGKKIEKIEEIPFYEYLLTLTNDIQLFTKLDTQSGYFYIDISGDGKHSLVRVDVWINVTDTDPNGNAWNGVTSGPITYYAMSGTNVHEIALTSTAEYTQLSMNATAGNWNVMMIPLRYKKPAHRVAVNGWVMGNVPGLACEWYRYNSSDPYNYEWTLNNTGHNSSDVYEYVYADVNIYNAGLNAYNGEIYHATTHVELEARRGGLQIDANGGVWNGNSSLSAADSTGWCGESKNIADPTRRGYTFKEWTFTNGSDSHASFDSDSKTFTYGGIGDVDAVYSNSYATLKANWEPNPYPVTYIDVKGTNIYGKQLGSTRKNALYDSIVSGADLGSSREEGAYYKDYYYIGSTSATVTDTGTTVYRFFAKTPAVVAAPNVLKNILRTFEINILKKSATSEMAGILQGTTFDVLEWSEKKGGYVPYLQDVSAEQKILVGVTLDNKGKFKVVETKAKTGYTNSVVEKTVEFSDAVTLPYYENSMVDEDKGVFVLGRTYRAGDIVRDKADVNSAKWYVCQYANIGKKLTDYFTYRDMKMYYWSEVFLGDARYNDLINGAGEWDQDSDVISEVGVELLNYTKPVGTTRLYITKLDPQGNTLGGAQFAAYYKDDSSQCEVFKYDGSQYKTDLIKIDEEQTHSTVNKDGTRTLKLTIKETKAPFGYKKCGDIEVTIKSRLNEDTDKWEVVSSIAEFPDGKQQDITSGAAMKVVDEPVKLNISLTKKVSVSGSTLPTDTLEGAVYGIYDNEDCTSLVKEVKISKNGTASAEGLTLKDYWIKEISSPTSGMYKLSSEVKHVDASKLYDGFSDVKTVAASVTVTEEPFKGEILVKKYAYTDISYSGTQPLKGAGFTLYAMPEIPDGEDEEEYVKTYNFSTSEVVKAETKTDRDGLARFRDLTFGKYVIVETSVPKGYTKAENQIAVISKEYIGNSDDTAFPAVFFNTPYSGRIRIYKVSEKDGKTLEGAVFRIFDVTNNRYITETTYGLDDDGNRVERTEPKLYTTDRNGLITTENQMEGTYRIEEVSAPDGYMVSEEPKTVTVADGKENGRDTEGMPYYEVTFKDKQTDTYIRKVDISTKKEIKGGHYTVQTTEGKLMDEWDGNGSEHHIYGLVPGTEYILTEVSAPDGYVVAESITFKIREDGRPTEVVMEDDYNKVEISKLDITEGSEIPGAHLQLFDSKGKLVEEWTSTDKPHRIDRLPTGTYTLKETMAPDGYVIAEDVEFYVGENSEVQKVEMYDDYTRTRFIKLDETTMEPIKGCVLQILDESGKEIERWTTDGEPHYVYRLTEGKTYTLHEVSAPDGYELAADIRFVAGRKFMTENEKILDDFDIVDKDGIGIDDDSHIKEEEDPFVEPEDGGTEDGKEEPEDGRDYEDTETEDLESGPDDKPTPSFAPSELVTVTMKDSPLEIIPQKVDENGNPVEGAHMQMIDAERNVVYDWITDVMSTYAFKVVPGTYTIHEVEAPAGYQNCSDRKITISDRDVEVHLVDHSMKVIVTKKDIKKQNIPGSKLQILDEKRNVVDEWITTDKPHITVPLLANRTYTLHEAVAAPGYELAEDITFKTSGTDVKVEMVDLNSIGLPFTGGNPFNVLILVIPLLLLGAAIFGISIRLKGKRKKKME